MGWIRCIDWEQERKCILLLITIRIRSIPTTFLLLVLFIFAHVPCWVSCQTVWSVPYNQTYGHRTGYGLRSPVRIAIDYSPRSNTRHTARPYFLSHRRLFSTYPVDTNHQYTAVRNLFPWPQRHQTVCVYFPDLRDYCTTYRYVVDIDSMYIHSN